MPISLPPHRSNATPTGESFLLKSILVASALFVGALVVVSAEFNFSPPGHSLSEAEAAAADGAVTFR